MESISGALGNDADERGKHFAQAQSKQSGRARENGSDHAEQRHLLSAGLGLLWRVGQFIKQSRNDAEAMLNLREASEGLCEPAAPFYVLPSLRSLVKPVERGGEDAFHLFSFGSLNQESKDEQRLVHDVVRLLLLFDLAVVFFSE